MTKCIAWPGRKLDHLNVLCHRNNTMRPLWRNYRLNIPAGERTFRILDDIFLHMITALGSHITEVLTDCIRDCNHF